MIYNILVNYRYATSKHGEVIALRDLNIRCHILSQTCMPIPNYGLIITVITL